MLCKRVQLSCCTASAHGILLLCNAAFITCPLLPTTPQCTEFTAHAGCERRPSELCVRSWIVMAPSGVQKERLRAEDMFVLDGEGNVVHTPEARPPPYKAPKLSECAPLFMSVSGWLHGRMVVHAAAAAAAAAERAMYCAGRV